MLFHFKESTRVVFSFKHRKRGIITRKHTERMQIWGDERRKWEWYAFEEALRHYKTVRWPTGTTEEDVFAVTYDTAISHRS